MEKSIRMARVLIGIGVLLTSVPLGLSIIAMLSSGEDAFARAFQLGWAVWVTVGLLPLGLGLLSVGMGWLVKLKRRARQEEENEDEEN